MRWIALLLALLISGCDLDTFQKENTIKAGRVYWDGPDIARLLTALDTCDTAPSTLTDLCTYRQNEALILLQALRTCAGNSLPACRGIMYWALEGEGKNWVYLMQRLELTQSDFDALPREDLEATLIPENRFIWAVWGFNDALEVCRRWIMSHLILVVLGIGLPLLTGIGLMIWRVHQARINRVRKAEQDRLDALWRAEQAKKAAEIRLAEEQEREAARLARAMADAAKRAREEEEDRQREVQEEAERQALAEAIREEEAKAKAILAKAFSNQQPSGSRPQKRKWNGPRQRQTQ